MFDLLPWATAIGESQNNILVFMDLHNKLMAKHQREEKELVYNMLFTKDVLAKIHYLYDKMDRMAKTKETALSTSL